MAKKSKSDEPKPKKSSKGSKALVNPASFYAQAIDKVDKDTRLYASSVAEVKRLSSGILCVDWLNGGGYSPSLAQNTGEEGVGKTTIGYHTIASSMAQATPINEFWDAEGTLSTRYGGSIFTPFGYDLKYLLDHPEEGFRYYRKNVIEKMFNSMKKQLLMMPDKLWEDSIKSWAYHIPKRDEYFKRMMSALNLRPDKGLTNDHFFICPTDNDRVEGLFFLDSWAALVGDTDEEEDEMSKQRAVEPALLSKHIKRIVAKLPDKQVMFLGTNQVRKIPGQTYGDPLYEPMGEALKFFTAQRARWGSRAVPSGFKRDPDNGSFCIEESVERPGAMDKYAFKKGKSTKNKFGLPGLTTWMRVWVGDHRGKPRGVDPYFDTIQYLLNSKQAIMERGKISFRLKPSMGKKLAAALNEIDFIDQMTFKRMIIGETTDNIDLIKKSSKAMGINFKPKLREACFKQMRSDDFSIYVLDSKKDKEVDLEEDDAEEL